MVRSVISTLLRPLVLTSRILLVSYAYCHTIFENVTDHLIGFFVAFSAQSGGIFVDMGVHDVS